MKYLGLACYSPERREGGERCQGQIRHKAVSTGARELIET